MKIEEGIEELERDLYEEYKPDPMRLEQLKAQVRGNRRKRMSRQLVYVASAFLLFVGLAVSTGLLVKDNGQQFMGIPYAYIESDATLEQCEALTPAEANVPFEYFRQFNILSVRLLTPVNNKQVPMSGTVGFELKFWKENEEGVTDDFSLLFFFNPQFQSEKPEFTVDERWNQTEISGVTVASFAIDNTQIDGDISVTEHMETKVFDYKSYHFYYKRHQWEAPWLFDYVDRGQEFIQAVLG